MTENKPLLILVDGHSLAFRCYYAHGKKGGLTTSTGVPTSITFGFIKCLVEVITKYQPQGMAIAFDLATPTFRHELDPTYKAGRDETPADFIPDLANLQELVRALGLPLLTTPGYEADDILATLTQQGQESGYMVKVLTGDRDMYQLVDEEKNTSVLYFSRDYSSRGSGSDIKEIKTPEVVTKLGILPSQVVDYKALCGDKSDNIPGVAGVGEKTAVQLLTKYHNLENIYNSLDEMTGAVKKKLEAGREKAFHSQHMARLNFEAPVVVTLEECRLKGFDPNLVTPILEKLELKSFLKNLEKIQASFGGEKLLDKLEQALDNPQILSLETTTQSAPNLSANLSPQLGNAPLQLEENFNIQDADIDFFTAEDTRNYQPAPEVKLDILTVDTPDKLATLITTLENLATAHPVAWDTETSDLDPRKAELVGIGCCWGENATAYIPLGHHLDHLLDSEQGKQLDRAVVLEALRPILEGEKYPKVLQNAKFDRLILRNQGINLAGVTFDTMLASYVLNPDRNHSLKQMAAQYLEINTITYEELVPKGKTIADIAIADVAYYCALDAYMTWHLYDHFQANLAEYPDLAKLFLTVELPLEPVLAEMEFTGIRIDTNYLQIFSQQLEQDLATIEKQAYAAAGEEFNLGSPKQLSVILFEKLKLDTKKSRKIKTGYSTDHATLEKLQGDHPVIEAILENRTLAKLKSTYVDALPEIVSPKTQRIHTDFNQAVTSTGRLSSSNPNLQNIPIRTAFSRQIRKAFLPKEGWLLAAADYSQIELRILAHLCQEPVLLHAYQNNEDIHTVTAKLIFEKEEISSEERRLGKIINFGVIYGMGAQKFAREAKVTVAQAKSFIDKFNTRYAQVFNYLEQLKREVISRGYVTTILGRRRYFQLEGDQVKALRGTPPEEIDLSRIKLSQYDSQALRSAANAPIQGSSADIIKIAMVKLHQVLQSYEAKLLLQVHDELVLEVPPAEWEELQPQIKAAMESAVDLTVPLLVEVRSGQNWMETK